jgi:hypothetical protein
MRERKKEIKGNENKRCATCPCFNVHMLRSDSKVELTFWCEGRYMQREFLLVIKNITDKGFESQR